MLAHAKLAFIIWAVYRRAAPSPKALGVNPIEVFISNVVANDDRPAAAF